MKHVFGPVPSRRLGFSLGVDPLVPKTCSMDCIYCELGRTTTKTVSREPYVDVDAVLRELESRLRGDTRVDHVTISGSGEPTLNSDLGVLIDGIRNMTDTPLALITNSTLLCDEDVSAQCERVDVLLPSLDAVSERAFRKVTRPHESLHAAGIVSGLSDFARRFKGRLWVETVFVKGVNDDPEEVSRLAQAMRAIGPERVHVNTVVRPPSEQDALPVGASALRVLANALGAGAEVIAGVREERQADISADSIDLIIEIASRRPVTVLDVTRALGTSQAAAAKLLSRVASMGLLTVVRHGATMYYRASYPDGGAR
jgi:wyosine [tRNA(Phe)-imidazoG37] synthetase (radical SAM superfamily)